MRALVWFRSDLRTEDNPALHEAARRADEGVVGVFTMAPGQWRDHDWADCKVEFLLRNLASLSERLRAINVPLQIVELERFREAPSALRRLARRRGCHGLFFSAEYEVNERGRDERVRRRFESDGLEVHEFADQCVLEPGEVTKKAGGWYTVFTPFKRTWIDLLQRNGIPSPLRRPRKQADTGIEPDPIPRRVKGFDLSRGRADLWPEGEDAARRRLDGFVRRRIDGYHEARDLPADDGTSALSPYLAAGVISVRRCLQAAVAANEDRLARGRSKPNGAETWVGELAWRDFYRHLLVAFPDLSKHRPFRPETEHVPWRDAPADLQSWCEGRTGFPIIDAAMRQLADTGWMHNRLRMITAMFLSKNLLIDWREGERHFMRHLVDGDLASNNGGWQWSASTGTDAVPYFRVFNPVRQSERYDADGEFIRRWVPELAELGRREIHDPEKWPAGRAGELGYPEPICDLGESRHRAIEAFRNAKK